MDGKVSGTAICDKWIRKIQKLAGKGKGCAKYKKWQDNIVTGRNKCVSGRKPIQLAKQQGDMRNIESDRK